MLQSNFIRAICVSVFLAGIPATATANHDGVLNIKKSDNGKLSYGQWEYRELSTRSRWWLGCWSYDVLQGTGWFPSTWYQYIDPTEDNGQLFYQTDRTARACYCDVQPDEFNSLTLTHVTDEGTELDGFLRIFPDFSVETTSITVRRLVSLTVLARRVA